MKGKGNLGSLQWQKCLNLGEKGAFLLQYLNPCTLAEQPLIATTQALAPRIRILTGSYFRSTNSPKNRFSKTKGTVAPMDQFNYSLKTS